MTHCNVNSTKKSKIWVKQYFYKFIFYVSGMLKSQFHPFKGKRGKKKKKCFILVPLFLTEICFVKSCSCTKT